MPAEAIDTARLTLRRHRREDRAGRAAMWADADVVLVRTVFMGGPTLMMRRARPRSTD